MKHVEIPEPVTIMLRNGERLRQTIADPKTGQPRAGDVMAPLSFFDYAECWFNNERLNAGTFKKRQQAAKIIASLDEVKAAKTKVWSIEDADYELLDPVVDAAVMFANIVFESQCATFVEAFKNAKSTFPAHLAPPKKKEKKT